MTANLAGAIRRILASRTFRVVLLLVLTGALGSATWLEKQYDSDFARWYVYESTWFVGLLLVAICHLLAVLPEYLVAPRRNAGPIAVCLGLMLLLVGCGVWRSGGGVAGRVVVEPGRTTSHILVHNRSQITAFWVGRPNERPYEFTFEGGPVDWRAGRSLDLGDVDGVHARVLAYVRHAQPLERWVDDASKRGGPAVTYQVSQADNQQVAGGTLVDQQYGDAVFVGPLRLQLERAAHDRMLEGFLDPPLDELGPMGRLAMVCGDELRWVDVDPQLHERVEFPAAGITVELAAYLANAVPDRLGHFTSKGDTPKNPMVELRVHTGDPSPPLRQIAFAKDPFLNLDGVYARGCPVKFRYYHPAIKPPSGLELLQTSDGRLHGRICVDGNYHSIGTVKSGSQVDLPGNFQLQMLEYLPHARQEFLFQAGRTPIEPSARADSQPAALVEIVASGHSQQVWMRRGDPTYGKQTIHLGDGELALEFSGERLPLGQSLELVEARRAPNPGNVGPAAAIGRIRMVSPDGESSDEFEVSANEPITVGPYRLALADLNDNGHGQSLATLRATWDPGRWFKSAGSGLVCLGMLMLVARKLFSSVQCRAGRRAWDSRPPAASAPPLPLKRIAALVLAAAIVVPRCAMAAPDGESFDWDIWRQLPVQDGGRHKPLDSLARESLRRITGRTDWNKPGSPVPLDPTALYVTLLLDWQGWQHPDRDQRQLVADWRPLYFYLHVADAWDHLPLLRIDYPPLAAALHIETANQIAPRQLVDCQIDDTRSEREIPFTAWADNLRTVIRTGGELTALERQGLALAERLGAYQDLRMGKSLELLPIADSDVRQWVSLAQFLMADLDDDRDPSGQLRRAQQLWCEVADAYQAHDGAAFNQAARQFIAAVREAGTALGEYPAAAAIERELSYNLWDPCGKAWVALALAAVGFLVQWKWSSRAIASGAIVTSLVGGLLLIVGLTLRATLAGRLPLTSMYESLVGMALGAWALGAGMSAHDRRTAPLAAASLVAALAVLAATQFPLVFDPSISPVDPVLRTNAWLFAHVGTIVLGLAALSLAAGTANVSLAYLLFRAPDAVALRGLSRLTHRACEAGILLVVTGSILGACWADRAWGRWWSWDTKEVWTVIVVLGYLAVTQARRGRWLGHFGFATATAACYGVVVMAWYGVNFVLATGSHSYGFGTGDQRYVAVVAVAQVLLVTAAASRVWGRAANGNFSAAAYQRNPPLGLYRP